jgi:hypothetical protein
MIYWAWQQIEAVILNLHYVSNDQTTEDEFESLLIDQWHSQGKQQYRSKKEVIEKTLKHLKNPPTTRI